MEITTAFRILETEKTKDKDIITESYRRILPGYNPEDDAEGFKMLREAFETAMAYAEAEEEGETEEHEPKTETDFWIKKAEDLYNDITLRRDVKNWKQLFCDGLCDDIDTEAEIRERFLVFLMENYFLPQDVWKEITEKFQIAADFDKLKEDFPEDFLEYVIMNAENKTFLPYELFEYISLDGEDAKPDQYIKSYFEVKRKLDAENYENIIRDLDVLKDYDVYHPYEDAERLRYYIHCMEDESSEERSEAKENCLSIIDRLSVFSIRYEYIYNYIGKAKWSMGDKEGAYAVWKETLGETPDSFRTRLYIAEYLYDKERYEEADKIAKDLCQINDSDAELLGLVVKINDVLIEKYQGQLDRGEENPDYPGQELILEIGWMLWQNERPEEAKALLESFEPDEKSEYGYCNLYGRLLYHMKEYEKSLPYLVRWKELLWQLDDIESPEKERRLKRRPMACSYLASCYMEVADRDAAAAEENIKQAISLSETKKDLYNHMEQYAAIMMECERYNDVVDICDDIISGDRGYYPAYLLHQEACYRLKKGQEVVNDYHAAANIVSDYYKPYMYAAMMFFNYRQYEDALKVLENARNNNVVFNTRMEFTEAQAERHMAQNSEDYDRLMDKHAAIVKKLETEKGDEEEMPTVDEIYCECAFVRWDANDYAGAEKWINRAIDCAGDTARYYYIKGDLLSDDGNEKNDRRFLEAIAAYKEAEMKGVKDDAWFYYSMGYCYEKVEDMENAVSYFKKALDIEAPFENICRRLVDHYLNRYDRTYKTEDLDNAMKYAEIEYNAKENAYTLWLMGRVYECGNEYHKAKEFYERAAELVTDEEPPTINVSFVYERLGCCYRRLMEYDKAVLSLKKSIEENGTRKAVSPYWNLAQCYTSMQRYEDAIETYMRVLDITPDDTDIWQNTGDCYRYMGCFDKAMEAYLKADPKKMDLNHAEVLFAQGDYKGAERFYKKTVTDKSKKDLDFDYILLGDFYLENLQDYNKALKCYEKSENVNSSAYNLLRTNVDKIKAYYMSGNMSKAKECAVYALNAFKKQYDVSEEEFLIQSAYRSIELYRFAWIYLGLGNEEKAKEYFRRMEELPLCKNCEHKGCYEAQLYLGIIYYMNGDLEEAVKAFEEAIRRNPHDWFSRQMLKRAKNII